ISASTASAFHIDKPVNHRLYSFGYSGRNMKLMMFVKHVQSLPIEQAAMRMREIGFGGMDLTVRPTGVVKPEHVRDELPRVVGTIRSHGLEVPLLTTDLLRADDAASATFETAASLGIREIKL